MRGTRKLWESVQRLVRAPLDLANAARGDTGCQRSISSIKTARQTLSSHIECATCLSKACHIETVLPELRGHWGCTTDTQTRQKHLRPDANHRTSAPGGLTHRLLAPLHLHGMLKTLLVRAKETSLVARTNRVARVIQDTPLLKNVTKSDFLTASHLTSNTVSRSHGHSLSDHTFLTRHRRTYSIQSSVTLGDQGATLYIREARYL